MCHIPVDITKHLVQKLSVVELILHALRCKKALSVLRSRLCTLAPVHSWKSSKGTSETPRMTPSKTDYFSSTCRMLRIIKTQSTGYWIWHRQHDESISPLNRLFSFKSP